MSGQQGKTQTRLNKESIEERESASEMGTNRLATFATMAISGVCVSVCMCACVYVRH